MKTETGKNDPVLLDKFNHLVSIKAKEFIITSQGRFKIVYEDGKESYDYQLPTLLLDTINRIIL
jgi:hypothetical protein